MSITILIWAIDNNLYIQYRSSSVYLTQIRLKQYSKVDYLWNLLSITDFLRNICTMKEIKKNRRKSEISAAKLWIMLDWQCSWYSAFFRLQDTKYIRLAVICVFLWGENLLDLQCRRLDLNIYHNFQSYSF